MKNKHKLVKKKPTKEELKELREIFISIRNDPVAMTQVRKLISQTA
ncbi:hypothetical protein J4423_01410 [Candidatus Pacearchaeota archaeon]|nr:hypothetical protein [Candidatus Pacearchaeota archaeon]